MALIGLLWLHRIVNLDTWRIKSRTGRSSAPLRSVGRVTQRWARAFCVDFVLVEYSLVCYVRNVILWSSAPAAAVNNVLLIISIICKMSIGFLLGSGAV